MSTNTLLEMTWYPINAVSVVSGTSHQKTDKRQTRPAPSVAALMAPSKLPIPQKVMPGRAPDSCKRSRVFVYTFMSVSLEMAGI